MHRVFVYGTLKRGLRNHRCLEKSSFVGDAYTIASYRMLDGPYPVLRDDGANLQQVSGEVFAIDESTLAKLDELEGVADGMYARIRVDVVLSASEGERGCAFIYIGCSNYWDKTDRLQYLFTDKRGHLKWLAHNARTK